MHYQLKLGKQTVKFLSSDVFCEKYIVDNLKNVSLVD